MNSIKISDIAAEQIKQHLQKYPNAKGMRISIKPSGCNGYSYVFKPEMLIEDTDTEISHNGISIFINEKDTFFLGDITIDYIKNGLNSNFDISNSLVKGECGCGQSFRV